MFWEVYSDMPNANPIEIGSALVGVGTGTMIAERTLMGPKAVWLYYVQIARGCYISTGSKRIACGVAAITCAPALIPGPHQPAFIIACAAAARGANKLG